MALRTSSEPSLRQLARQIGDAALPDDRQELKPSEVWLLLKAQLEAAVPADAETVRIAKRNGLFEVRKKGIDRLPSGARELLRRHHYESKRYVPPTPSGGAGGYWQHEVKKADWIDLLSRHADEVRACFGIPEEADPETALALLSQALLVGALETPLRERYVEPLRKAQGKELKRTVKEAKQRRRRAERAQEEQAPRESPYRDALEGTLADRPPLSALDAAAAPAAPGLDSEIDGPGR